MTSGLGQMPAWHAIRDTHMTGRVWSYGLFGSFTTSRPCSPLCSFTSLPHTARRTQANSALCRLSGEHSS